MERGFAAVAGDITDIKNDIGDIRKTMATKDDVRAIVAYLRSVKPISNKVEKSTFKIPLPANYGPIVTTIPDVPRTDKVAYGRYIATNLAHRARVKTSASAKQKRLRSSSGVASLRVTAALPKTRVKTTVVRSG